MNTNTRVETIGRIPIALVRNTILNFLGESIPILVSFIAIPIAIRGLGIEQFGILSLMWVMIGYFTLFDFGLGRATTRYVAEHVKEYGQHADSRVVDSSLLVQALLGCIGAGALLALIPLLTGGLLKIPPQLVGETRQSLYWFSLAIPFLIYSSALRGLLEAGQRFDLVNAVKGPAGCLVSLSPVLGLAWHFGLSEIVLLQFLTTVISTLAYQRCVRQVLPWLKGRLLVDPAVLHTLGSYAGWTTLLTLASSVVLLLDRFLTGTFLSMSAVGYYSPPYMLTSRLWIIPQSLFMVTFPVFSALDLTQQEELERAFVHALRLLVLTVAPVTVVLVLFATEILKIWLGVDFALHSGVVLQLLVIGFFMNSLGWIPSTFLQGIGRPDIVAKIFVGELPFYGVLIWWLIGRWGIEGAALAWALRGGAEAILFLFAAWKIGSFRVSVFVHSGALFGGLIVVMLILMGIAAEVWGFSLSWRLSFCATFLITFTFVVKAWVLPSPEDHAVASTLFQTTQSNALP